MLGHPRPEPVLLSVPEEPLGDYRVGGGRRVGEVLTEPLSGLLPLLSGLRLAGGFRRLDSELPGDQGLDLLLGEVRFRLTVDLSPVLTRTAR